MAKRKGKVELIEKTLDQEIEGAVETAVVVETTEKSEKLEEPLVARSEKKSFSKLKFFGRPYLEARFPESLNWADRFAQDWRHEGSFEFIEVPHPLAKDMLISGIKNIRAAEKRVEHAYHEKILPLAEEAKKKVENIIRTVRM
jgi:hypothetical protein